MLTLCLSHLLKILINPLFHLHVAELLKVEEAGGYEKDVWAMSEGEKLSQVPRLRQEGNALFGKKEYAKAAETYGKAIGILEQLLLRCGTRGV